MLTCSRLLTLCAFVAAGLAVMALPIGDIRALTDWSDLPRLGTGTWMEATNTHPGPNYSKLVDAVPGQCILLEAKGPGCLTRLSIYATTGTLKVYLDGAGTPKLEVPLAKMYQSIPIGEPDKMAKLDEVRPQTYPFLIPFAASAPGWVNNSYVPIPYAKSVRVVLEHAPADIWKIYSIAYMQYPEGTAVTSFDPDALAKREPEVRAAAKRWLAMGEAPFAAANEQTRRKNIIVPARATAELAAITGSGSVVGIRLRVQPWQQAVDRQLVLRAYWDGETRPSVEVPIGDFCAGFHGVRMPRVLPVGGGGKDGWYWCYLPMPFATSVRLTVENLSKYPITSLDYEITVRPGATSKDAGRFCARWTRVPALGEDGRYELLAAMGAGKLVGYNLSAMGYKTPSPFAARKSVMQLTRDAETEPGVFGTSLMPYFYNGAYGGPNWDTPLTAIPEMDFAERGTYAQYKFFLTDGPEWTKSAKLVFDMSKDEVPAKDLTSTVYWYRAVGGTDTLPPVAKANLLLPMAQEKDAFEAEALLATAETTRGEVVVVDDIDQRYGVSGNRYLAYAPLAFGDSITFHIPVATAGTYELKTRAIVGPSGGFWDVSVNGSPFDPKSNDVPLMCTADETAVMGYWKGGWKSMGKFTFRAGDNRVTFIAHSPWVGVIQRGLLLTLDALKVVPVK